MKDSLRQILGLLSKKEKYQMLLLTAAILVMALFEVVGVASIMPFIAVLANPEVISTNHILGWLYGRFSFETTNSYLIFLGVAVLGFMVTSNAFTAFTMRRMLRFTYMRNYVLARRLLINYVNRPYQFFLNRNSADLGKNVLNEVAIVVTGVLVPGMLILSRSTVALALVAGLFIVNPKLAAIMFAVVGGVYLFVYLLSKRKIVRIGKARVEAQGAQYRLASELFGGIKDIKVLGAESDFIDRFSRCSENCARYHVTNNEIAILPKYIMESVIFGSILVVILFYLATAGTVNHVLPMLAFFGLAGYRLMPSVQQVFSSLTTFQYNLPAVKILYSDMQWGDGLCLITRDQVARQTSDDIRIQRVLRIENVSFAYAGTEIDVLKDITLHIQRNKTIALVGATGSGKTTLVDLIMGLITPREGGVFVDHVKLHEGNIRAWRSSLGYVPQQIYLSDDSVRRNIAFGLPDKLIVNEHVERAARIANIHEFVSTLPGGYETRIGERGVRLSGGQRQRLGIARALYRDPDLLIMDEGTSSLDGITEDVVMQAINTLSHEKTVILVAHRLTTVRNCDVIYLLEQGRIVEEGTYEELMNGSALFRCMANKGLGDAANSALEIGRDEV